MYNCLSGRVARATCAAAMRRCQTGLVASCLALMLQVAKADVVFSSAVLSCMDGDDSSCKTAASFTAAVSEWDGTTSLSWGSETGHALPLCNRHVHMNIPTAACTATYDSALQGSCWRTSSTQATTLARP